MALVGYDDSDFARVLRDRSEELDRLSYVQKVPGLDRDDVRQEMVNALWKAHLTFDPEAGTTLGQWWWVVWIRRKADLIESFFAQKNRGIRVDTSDEHLEVLATELGDSLAPLVTIADLCPSQDRIERAMWVLLAAGFTGVEVRNLLEISRRRFYSIVDTWRTAEVRAVLHCT